MPILINIPKSLEKNVEFLPGKGNNFGYLCYSKMLPNETVVVFTPTQYTLNLVNDIAILIVIVTSGLVTFIRFRQHVEKRKRKISAQNELAAMALNIQARMGKNHIAITASVTGIFYILFRLPLYIMANPWNIEGQNYLMTGLTVILYIMQFCCHFLIHTLLSKSYRDAFKDLLRPIMPCCFMCKPHKKKENEDEGENANSLTKSEKNIFLSNIRRLSSETH